MVGANFEGLISSHNKASLAVLLVLEQSHITSTALLPLLRASVELEKFGTPTDLLAMHTHGGIFFSQAVGGNLHLEGLLLRLLVGLNLRLLKGDDGIEMDIGGFRRLLL